MNERKILFFCQIACLTGKCGFSTPNNSPILCRHQLGVLQLNSDLNYLELTQTSKNASTSNTNDKSPVILCTSEQLAVY